MADLEDVTLDGRPLQSLRVTDLKAALEERGLPKSGQKSALVKRLKGALMLENLQKHSTPHSGLQPNSQIGEEMCQNSFIKQYLEKQQELLRQRLEREAREAAEIGDKGLVASSEKEDSEEELPRKRERRSPRVQQTRTKTPSAEEEQEPHLRPRRAKLEWDVKLAEEEEEEEEEEGEEEEWNAVRAPAVARKHRDVSRKKPMTGVQPSLAGRYPSPPELLEGEDSASLEARVPPLLSKETFGDQCAPLIERSKGRTSPGGKVSPVKEKAEELTPIQGSCFHILDKTGHWAPVVAYPVSAKAGRKPPSPAQLYRTEKKEAKPAPHFEVSETIKRPTSPVCRAQESLLSLGPAVREPQHKKQRQEPSGDTVKDPAPETQREKFPGPVRQDLEPQRQKQESPGPISQNPSSETLRQESPGPAVAESETLRQEFPGPAVVESETLRQEFPGPAVVESETLRQESPGPAVAESERLRQESPGPAVAESERLRQESPGPAVPESERLRQKSPGPAVPESERLRQESPGPAVAESERLRQESPGPAVVESERLRQESPGPAVAESERLRQESPGPAVAESERLRQESPGPAVAESERLRQESPGPAVAESETHLLKSTGLPPQDPKSETLISESSCCAVAEPQTQKLERPGSAPEDPWESSSPSMEDPVTVTWKHQFPGPAVKEREPEAVKQKSPSLVTSQDPESEPQRRLCPGAPGTENGTALVVQHPAERPGVSTMSQLPAGAGTEFHSTEGEQGRSTESPAETPQGQRQRAPSRSPSSSRQRRTPSFSSRSSSSESSSRSSSRYRSRSSSSWRSRSRSRSGSDSASRSRSRSTSSSRSRTSRRSRSSLGSRSRSASNSCQKSGSPEPHRDSPSGGRAVVQEHPPAPTESAPEGSAPPKPPRLHRNRWNVGPEQNTAAAALPVQQQESLQEPWQRPPEQEGCVLHPDSEQEAAAVEVVAPQAGGAAGIARVPMAQKVHEHEPRKSRDNVVEKEAAMDTEESRPEAEGASETELRDTVASDPNEERTEAAPPSEEDEKKETPVNTPQRHHPAPIPGGLPTTVTQGCPIRAEFNCAGPRVGMATAIICSMWKERCEREGRGCARSSQSQAPLSTHQSHREELKAQGLCDRGRRTLPGRPGTMWGFPITDRPGEL